MNALSLSLLVLVQSVRCTNGLRTNNIRMFSQQALQRTARSREHSLSDLPLPTPPIIMPIAPEWMSSVVVKNTKHAEGLRSIDIQVQEEIAALYNQPGQYMKMKMKTKTGNEETKSTLLSIASPPDQRKVLSFLVKESAPHEFLINTKAGDVLDLSAPMGKGFQIEQYFENYHADFPVNNVLMIACGSGLAPIAAAIESDALGLGQAQYKSIFARKAQLYVGARSPAHLPYADQYARWQAIGIQVIPVFSRMGYTPQPHTSSTSSTSTSAANTDDECMDIARVGLYVQEALRQDTVRTPRNTAALLCGMRNMTDSVRSILLEAGVFEGRILLNT